MANCETCGNTLKFFENMKTIGSAKRCGACIDRFNQTCSYWLQTLEAQFYQQGGVSGETEAALLRNLQEARVPIDLGNPVLQRMRYLRYLSEIRWGKVPVVHAPMHLDSDETAHFFMPGTYHKPLKNVKIIPGQIVGTSKKLYFQSSSGTDSHVIDWNNVSRIDEKPIFTQFTKKVRTNKGVVTKSWQTQEKGIQVNVTKGSGGGDYVIGDPLRAKILIDTLVRLWKRQLVIYQEQKTQGPVPDHVKAAVWQRDGGKCVQCGSEADEGKYIEYDHIVPRSKGGPNTVENIQLLCRMCNLKKGDRL